MPYQQKNKSKITQIAIGLAMGWGVAVITMLLVTILVATLVAGQKIEEGMIAPGAVAATILASFLGALFTVGKIGEKRMIYSLISGGIYYITLLCMNALFFEGTYRGLGAAALTITGSCVVVGLMGFRQKNHKNKRFNRRYKV